MEHLLVMWGPWIIVILSIASLFAWGAAGDTGTDEDENLG